MTILAQTTPPEAGGFLQFWIILIFLANGVSLVVSIVMALANRKQRREVTFGFDPASKEEFTMHKTECQADRAALRAEMITDRRNNETHASSRSKTLYDKIDAVRLELTEKNEELRGEMQRNFQDTERALGRIEGKLDETRHWRKETP